MHDTPNLNLPAGGSLGPAPCSATEVWERLRARWRCRARWALLPVAPGPWYPAGAAEHRVLVVRLEREGRCGAACGGQEVLWSELNPWPAWGTETWTAALQLWARLCAPGQSWTGAELLRSTAVGGYRASRSALERAFGYSWPQDTQEPGWAHSLPGKQLQLAQQQAIFGGPRALAVTALLGGTAADLEAEALAYVQAGWRAFKLKIRPGLVSLRALDRCLSRCTQVCGRGQRLRWMLDANGTLTAPEWRNWLAWGQDCLVDWALEQPFPVGQEAQAHEAVMQGGVQVYWDESVCSPAGLKALLATGLPYGYVIKPAVCPVRVHGLLREASCYPWAARWYCSSAFEGPIGLSYTLALAGQQPDEPVGLGTLAHYRPLPYTLAPALRPWPFTQPSLEAYWGTLQPCQGLSS